MTFQIGIIASDGILLASDTLQLQVTGIEPPTTEHVEKIVIAAQKNLAYCCAGDELGPAIGKEIENAITVADHRNLASLLIGCAEKVIKDPTPQKSHGTILIVCGEPLELWKIDAVVNSPRPLHVRRIQRGFTTAGYGSNYARFFLERYLGEFPYPPGKPTMSQVMLLASHTVVNAGALGSGQIGGLEMVLCRRGQFERVTPEKIEELERLSFELHKEIRRQLTN